MEQQRGLRRDAMQQWADMKHEAAEAASDDPKEQARLMVQMIHEGRARRPGHAGTERAH